MTKDTGPPKRYLGATISRYHLDGINCWASSAKDYIEKAIAGGGNEVQSYSCSATSSYKLSPGD